MNFQASEETPRAVTTRFPDAPLTIQALPVDRRGYPVPFFVPWLNGEPDFRVADERKLLLCMQRNLCWICGKGLGRMKAFAIGPMCAVNRITSEPPSHPMCATFAAKACPFLTRPLAKRPAQADLDGVSKPPPGVMLEHNPGVTLIWQALGYSPLPTDGGFLFQIGDPRHVEWWREGRPATREECQDAIALGLPHLAKMAQAEGPEAVTELAHCLGRAIKLLPA